MVEKEECLNHFCTKQIKKGQGFCNQKCRDESEAYFDSLGDMAE